MIILARGGGHLRLGTKLHVLHHEVCLGVGVGEDMEKHMVFTCHL